MSSRESLAPAFARLERASVMAAELEAAIAAFFAGEPFEVRVQTDPETQLDTYRMRLVPRVPRALGQRTRAIARELVAALDAMTKSLSEPGTFRRDRFPFANSADAWARLLDHGSRHRQPNEQAFLKALAAHPGGNETLHSICSLRRTRPGRMLKAGARARTVLVHEGQSIGAAATLSAPRWNNNKREIVISANDPAAQLSGRAQVSFYVTLRTAEDLSHRPLQSIVAGQIDAVRKVLEAAQSLPVPPGAAQRPPQRAERHPGQATSDEQQAG